MTRNYNRTGIFNFFELTDMEQADMLENFSIEREEAEEMQFVISVRGRHENGEAIPLNMFIKTEKNNFTHGIFSDSYFSGYYLTLSRCGTEGVIAYKYF